MSPGEKQGKKVTTLSAEIYNVGPSAATVKGMLSPAGVQRSHKRRHILLVCLHSECKVGIINRLTSGGQQHSSTSPRGWGLVVVGAILASAAWFLITLWVISRRL